MTDPAALVLGRLSGVGTVHGFLKPFDGFDQKDFDTYSQDKWSSNLHNLQRMQVKQKLTALGALVAPEVAKLGLSLDQETSAERPSIWNRQQVRAQWLFFLRDGRSQKELQAILDRERSLADNIDDPAHHHRHIIMAVRVNAAGADVVCGLHKSAWLDRRNLQRKWTLPHERTSLMHLLKRLAHPFMGVSANEESWPLEEANEGLLEQVFSGTTSVDGWLTVGRHFPASEPVLQTVTFAQHVMEVFRMLAPVYTFMAWSKANDHVSLADAVSEEKKAKRRGHVGFEENETVEIVGGLFAGQRGIVQGLDKAGKVKVRVGSLTLPVNAGSLKRLSQA